MREIYYTFKRATASMKLPSLPSEMIRKQIIEDSILIYVRASTICYKIRKELRAKSSIVEETVVDFVYDTYKN